ncbi:substrate-binding domain-containing protein [Herbivorax sp. ANBcel31]|uniref:substrate-binding domain-containing protein n=1 Tax=Herbivorax sp. ANBcel31 TaxID=3069754 RepID=UPI0027B5D724|nr:substrate-binding domain-containing protein [Herbivorax sp. ANBcel31]MDQ2087879.1 substrate-binding domain-containing protein [Herbivorax sp. ANBcel31]
MKKRKTIGVMVTGIDGNYLTHFWLMMKKASEQYDCNLIVYDGRALKYNAEADGNHTIVYGFVDKSRIDGLIMTSSAITSFIDESEFKLFISRFKGIPLVSIGKVLSDASNILIDNKEGMKEEIRHLVNHHGYRKIAFVRGPKNNLEAIERYDAYLEVLKENDIKIDQDIIFEGDFISRTGYEIMKDIVIKDIYYDAIVFSNDDMALGATKALKDLSKVHNFDVSKKNVICGFDDSINSSFTKPPLTTVRQPFEEICDCSIRMILDKIDGKKTDRVVKVPSALVVRETCGCKPDKASSNISDSYLRLVPNISMHENIQTYSLESLYNKITEILKICNLRSCFISTYAEGTVIYKDHYLFDLSYEVPKKSELIYAFYNEKKAEYIEENIKYFNTKDIVPDCYIPNDRRFIYLVNPLFFNNEHFGFICIEIVNDDVLDFEPLRGQVSNSLKGALMLLERENMQKVLLESERLASLGHLIGGISHNLMTPIMSISGATSVIEDLVNEYKESIGDSNVTNVDHHEISDEMKMWIKRLKDYNSYMSGVISTVKRQAVQLNSDTTNEFSVSELIDKVEFLVQNSIKLKKCNLNIETNINTKILIEGALANLVQIIDNLIINAVESYDEKDENAYRVNMFVYLDGNMVVFKIRDYGRGIFSEYKDKIFKHMITSKGKNGTGLSLLLSYSTIKGKYRGEMWFEDAKDGGTAFYISIPAKKQ